MPELLDEWLETTMELEPTTDLLSGWLATTEPEPVEEPTWWEEAWGKVGDIFAPEERVYYDIEGNVVYREPFTEKPTYTGKYYKTKVEAPIGTRVVSEVKSQWEKDWPEWIGLAITTGLGVVISLPAVQDKIITRAANKFGAKNFNILKQKFPQNVKTPEDAKMLAKVALKNYTGEVTKQKYWVDLSPASKTQMISKIAKTVEDVTLKAAPKVTKAITGAGKALNIYLQNPQLGLKTVSDLQIKLQQILPQLPAIVNKLVTMGSGALPVERDYVLGIISANKIDYETEQQLHNILGTTERPREVTPEEKIVAEAGKLEEVSPYGEKFVAPPIEPPTIPPRVPPSDVPTTPGEPEPEIDPIDKLNELLKAAKPLRGAIERAYTEERGKRIARVHRIIQETIDSGAGKKGFQLILSELRGELIDPEAKPRFETVEDKLTKGEVDALYLKTMKHPYLSDWEKVTTTTGLTDLFKGNIPPPSTLVLMEEVYGSELIKNLLSKRLWGAKATDFALEAANIPRALLATADMSAFLRQGVIEIAAHPIISTKAMAKTFEFAFKPETFEQYYSKDLKEHKHYDLMRKSGVAITDPRKPVGEREEPFISRLLQKVPIIKIPVEFAERAYTGFLTKLRVDVFSLWADELLGQGKSPIKDKKLFDAAADVVNAFTGRGSLGKAGNRIAPQLNAIFFSPRLIAARFNAMNPVWYAKQPPEIRKKALGDFAKFVIAGTTTLALIKLISMDNDDFDVETDPRSADFGKVRVGNTRFDIWGGHQQFVRAFTQIIMGERKSSTTGEIMSLNKDEYPFSTRQDVLYRFIEGKLAPGPALIRELMAGAKTFEGEDITISSVATQKLIPMYIQDIVEAYRDGGLGIAVPAGALAFFGIGVQTYGKPKTKRRQRWK